MTRTNSSKHIIQNISHAHIEHTRHDQTTRATKISKNQGCHLQHFPAYSQPSILTSYHLSIIRIKPNHEIIIPTTNRDLPTTSRRILIPFTLTKRTRQVLKREFANSLRERGRRRRIREEAVNSRDGIAIGAGRVGRLPDAPGALGDGDGGDLGHETGAGVDSVAVNGRTDAVSPALLAGIRGGVAGDVADVGEAADVGLGGAADGEHFGVGGAELVVGVGDESLGDDGFASTLSGRGPMDHALGVEMVYGCCDAGC